MDFLLYFQAFVLGIIEGLTEFIPVSSTGHLIIAAELMDFWTHEKRVVFEVAIQLGAILAVVYDYAARLRQAAVGFVRREPVSQRFVTNLLVGFMPAAVIGFFAIDFIHDVLFDPLVVASALIIGGVIILLAERRAPLATTPEVEDIRWPQALKIGFVQCLAMIPGTSRSGATIIGGLWFGLSRKAAAEFSFFLAIPTMIGATVYSVYIHWDEFLLQDLPVFAIGFVMAFVAAALVVNALVGFVSRHGFYVFAWYRIAFGLLIWATAASGLIRWS